MSMHVDLSPEMEGFVKSKVDTGFYGNATEDIRMATWKAAIKVGDDQLDQGEGIPYTASTLKDITEIALRDQQSFDTPNSNPA